MGMAKLRTISSWKCTYDQVDKFIIYSSTSMPLALTYTLDRYDRGNLVLTDFDLKILNILRPRVAGEERFLVKQTKDMR